MERRYPSKLLDNAVNQFKKLPGIGEKTALRLVLHLFNMDKEQVEEFSSSILKLKTEAHRCKICNNLSDGEVCEICSDQSRDHSIVCVVEDIPDLLAIERTGQYRGVYHVLGGLISPMDGIGPSNLFIDSLIKRIEQGGVKEVIFALNTTPEGDATSLYLYNRLKPYNIQISTIARGVGFGDELQYTDEITLGMSIVERMPFEKDEF